MGHSGVDGRRERGAQTLSEASQGERRIKSPGVI